MAGGTGVAVHQYTTTPTTTAGGEAGSRRATPQPGGARSQYAAWWCMAGVRGALLHDIIQYALFLLVIVT